MLGYAHFYRSKKQFCFRRKKPLDLNPYPSYCKLHINVMLRLLLQIQIAATISERKRKPLDLNSNPSYCKLHINVRLHPLLHIPKQRCFNKKPFPCSIYIHS